MAKKHILSLEIPDVANCEIFSIWDTSEYSDQLPIDCPTLSIVPPGFQNPISLDQTENFHRDFSTCAFGLQTMDCSNTRNTFPDGIYVIRWSVAPHDKVYVEYNHLRITSIMKMYYEKLNELDTSKTEPLTSIADTVLQLRKDEVKSKNIREQILKNSPEENKDFFVVPKVVE